MRFGQVTLRIGKPGWHERRLRVPVQLCLTAGLLAACGLQPANPDKLFDNAVSGLSGKDNFAFVGQTKISLNGRPSQPGVAFRGTVTGHNQLSMQVVNGEPGLDLATDPKQTGNIGKNKETTVVLSRKQEGWIASGSQQAGEADQLVRWNPLSHLERLNVMNKQVSADKGTAQPGIVGIAVTPEPEDVTAQLRAELDLQLQALQPGSKLKELQLRLQLTDEQTAAMRPEVERSLLEAKSKVEEMRNSLSAQSTYHIGVDRKSNLPRLMTVVTNMHYSSAGIPKDETTEVAYTFGQ